MSVLSHARLGVAVAATSVLTFVSGCQPVAHKVTVESAQQASPSLQSFTANAVRGNATGPQKSGQAVLSNTAMHGLVRVQETKLVKDNTLEITVSKVNQTAAGENIINLDSHTGLLNYMTAVYPHRPIRRVWIHSATGDETEPVYITGKNGVSQSVNASAATFALGQHIQVPPPGTTIDHTASPLANLDASAENKADAVLHVASELDGTAYVWGDSKDKGQATFDCASFVAYVYHRALGYQMSSLSRVQWDAVGIETPIWDRRKGDLLIFDGGKHVGIYAGNDEMIQAGGGLNKVGYVSIGPESYWGKRLSSVRRMY